jgi:hypothetical protein
MPHGNGSEVTVTKAEIRSHLIAIESLIKWSELRFPSAKDCVLCGTPTLEYVVKDAAVEAVEFFKDLLL